MPDTYKQYGADISEVIDQSNNTYIAIAQGFQAAQAGTNYVPFMQISLSCVTTWTFTSRQPIEREFARLANIWKQQTGHLSNVTTKCMHAAYQQIIGMGRAAIPFILRDLRDSKKDWFWALTSIAGENPILPQHAGKINRMTEAWLQWGRSKGYAV